jgi:hypothetical protein
MILPDDLSFDEDPDETIFLRSLSLAAFSARAITHFLLSSVLDTGIVVEVKTRKLVFILQEWSGDYLQKIKTSLSKQRNLT